MSSSVKKVAASYQLPKSLYRWVRIQAIREDLRPSELVARELMAARRRLSGSDRHAAEEGTQTAQPVNAANPT